ncbi:DUF4397 domain-containing protein [Chitinophaga sp. MM2321]|uniref:DUF4397 domain-containing protein n=1 Tax=Chitinophaga sp. MM2321 TaxID=3137178 RepID=UPI0032D57CB3
MKQLTLSVIIVLALLAACKKDSDSSIPVTQSNFLFFNGVPGTAQFGVLLDTMVLSSNIGYGENTGYKQYRAQKYNIYLYNTLTPGTLLPGGEINLRNGRFFSAYLSVDTVAKQYLLRTTEDDISSLGKGTAKFRIMNLSQTFKANQSPLGIDVYSDTFPRIFTNITFTTLTPFAAVGGDSAYTLNFRRPDTPVVVLKKLPFQTETGKVYTLITSGNALDTATFRIFTIQHN